MMRRLGRAIGALIAGAALLLLVTAGADPQAQQLAYGFTAGLVSAWVFDALFA